MVVVACHVRVRVMWEEEGRRNVDTGGGEMRMQGTQERTRGRRARGGDATASKAEEASVGE